MTQPDVSIIVPVYGSQATLRPLVERTMRMAERSFGPYEILLIDDGSSDGSWAEIETLQAEYPDHVVGVQLMRNFGQHNALMCGFRLARGRILVTMDDDLQHFPEDIPQLVAALDGLDLVYGRFEQRAHARWRQAGSLAVTSFFRFVFKLPVTLTSFRAIRRELVELILAYDLNFTFVDGLLAWNTCRIGEVPVRHAAREAGRSGYSLRSLIRLACNVFTNFSTFPLHAASLVGFVASLLGLTAAVYYLAAWSLNWIQVPGYASTIVAVLVLGGVQLLSLGMLGEYIGRIHLSINRKPQYAVRQMLSATQASEPGVWAGVWRRQASLAELEAIRRD